MDFNAIINQLNDLPETFRRPGQPYTWLIDALAAGLYLLCQASDALQAQYNFNTAQDTWLDVWGDISGFSRNINEPNSSYQNRIQETILAWRDSLVAIITYISSVEGVTTTITENTPVGYTIYVQGLEDITQIQKIIFDLRYIRPAGVPFSVISKTGTYLNTINYYGTIGTNGIPSSPNGLGLDLTGRVTGAYLANTQPIQLGLKASTNNIESLLPDLMFTDPTLNINPI